MAADVPVTVECAAGRCGSCWADTCGCACHPRDEAASVFACGCSPQRGVICTTHCQWQGCTDTAHTDRCVRGERLPDRC